jgi:GT2 family glycosyltransferase
MNKKVTLVVTTWNSLDMLKLFLKYLRKYTPDIYELIIVNNGSTDGTKEYLENNVEATIINNKDNLGVVVALDQADKLVKTKYMVSISDDILVTPNWLEDLVRIYESDPKIKTVAPFKPGTKIAHPYSDSTSRKFWDDIQLENLKAAKKDLLDMYTKGNYEKFVDDIKKVNAFDNQELECPFDFVSGCCVLVEKEFIDSIGGFSDTRFHIYGCEDVDRCWRIGKAGYKVIRTSEVYVHHFEGVSLKKNKLAWKKLTKENNKLLVEKWDPYFWELLDKKIKQYGSIQEVAKKHWILQWLLESVEKDTIPAEMQDRVLEYLESAQSKLS